MSEDSKMYRQQMRDKAERLVRTDPKERVDASGYTPPDALDADVQTGARPVSRRQYKSGGVVIDGKAVRRGDRKPRASGGNTQATPNNLQNRDMREANEERAGYKHIGGFKRGGHAHEDEAQDKKLIKAELKKHDAHCKCAECYGGRAERATGGKLGDRHWHVKQGSSMSKVRAPDYSGALERAAQIGFKKPDSVVMATDKDADTAKAMRAYSNRREGGSNWIKDAIKHPGSLHKSLHVKEGEKIPEKKLEKAEHSKNPHLARKARLAETLKSMPHKGGGGSSGVRRLEMSHHMAAERRKGHAAGGSMTPSDSRDGDIQGTRPVGGRLARKSGGKTKGKTNINIIIGAGQKEPAPMPMGMPPPGPLGMRQGVPPPPMPQQGPAMPPQGAPMMRKSGGRT